MRREHLEHIIRAAGDLLGETEVIVVGSQAVLGSVGEGIPAAALRSLEADVMAIDDPDGTKAMRINGNLGEMTLFDETNGYFAEGVGEGVSRFPDDWRDRMIPFKTENTNGVTGWCVEVHDICISKLLANRDKDHEYVTALINSGHARPEILIERLESTPSSSEERTMVIASIQGKAKPGRKSPVRRAIKEALKRIDKTTEGRA
jgi:hypothetical protein